MQWWSCWSFGGKVIICSCGIILKIIGWKFNTRDDESYRGKRTSQFSRWLKTALNEEEWLVIFKWSQKWRRHPARLIWVETVQIAIDSPPSLDLSPQFQNVSTQLWFIMSDHYIPNQSLLVTSHVGEKSYDWSDSVQVRDVKKRRKQSIKGEPILHCLELISLVAEEATIREYCG